MWVSYIHLALSFRAGCYSFIQCATRQRRPHRTPRTHPPVIRIFNLAANISVTATARNRIRSRRNYHAEPSLFGSGRLVTQHITASADGKPHSMHHFFSFKVQPGHATRNPPHFELVLVVCSHNISKAMDYLLKFD